MTCGKADAPGYTCGGSKKYVPCGRHFGSLDSFDRHFIADQGAPVDDEGFVSERCATDDELKRMGLVLSTSLVWRQPMEQETIDRLRGGPSMKDILLGGG